MSFRIRKAVPEDIPSLQRLIEVSVRALQTHEYTPAQITFALQSVYGVDSQLIADGTYLVAETTEAIVGCGGWSKRKTLFGGDVWSGRQDDFLTPGRDAAKIRAFFVDSAWARHGVGTMILQACEDAARAAGFLRFELGSTLTGIPFYRARGYVELEHVDIPMPDGDRFAVVRMVKPRPD